MRKGAKEYTTIEPYRFKYFDSLQELIAFLESHENTTSTFNSSQQNGGKSWCKRSYDEFIETCKTLKGIDDDIAKICQLTENLKEFHPSGRNYKRQRVMASHGVSINTRRVLHGDFAHAWRGFRRQSSNNGYGVVPVIIDATHSGNTSIETIFWSTATIIALTDHLENMGRETDVFAVKLGNPTYTNAPRGDAILTKIKSAGEAWNIHQCALISQPEWLRRVEFKVIEIMGQRDNQGNYGTMVTPAAESLRPIFEHIGYDGKPIIGPSTHNGHGISSSQDARQWIEDQISMFDNNA